jgi:hypothetical protein
VAKVMYARLCREIKRDNQTNRYSLIGSFVDLAFTNAPIGFVFVVYWDGDTLEAFSQSFALVDEAGNILDQTPTLECVLNDQHANISTAIFYTIFPSSGHYNVRIYQNGICTETIPIQVIEHSEARSWERAEA